MNVIGAAVFLPRTGVYAVSQTKKIVTFDEFRASRMLRDPDFQTRSEIRAARQAIVGMRTMWLWQVAWADRWISFAMGAMLGILIMRAYQ